MRIVSWIEHCWASALLAIVMAGEGGRDGQSCWPTTQERELLLTVLAQEGDSVVIRAPDDVFDRRRRELGEDLLLLQVKERD